MKSNRYFFSASIRFKGTVCEEYREEVFLAFLFGNWYATKDRIFEIIRTGREDTIKIPFRDLKYPEEWVGTDGDNMEYQNRFNRITGEWVFTSSVFDKEEFDNLFYYTLPFIIEHVEVCEVWWENLYKRREGYREGKVVSYELKDNRWIKQKS